MRAAPRIRPRDDGTAGRFDPAVAPLVPRGDAMLETVAANFCAMIGAVQEEAAPRARPVLIAAADDAARRKLRLRSWDQDLCVTDLRLDPDRRRDRDIQRTATIMLDLLRARWPAQAQPARIGILSDGTGVALVPEDPWPLDPGWIDRRLADPRGLVALKRFAPDGGLALLRAPRCTRAGVCYP